ncbi:hypothetical protein [Halorhabdus salina]|uniref:hypothetical protein n=1 Tax=Halorhabdus salina TaxID=2750670 RepID=UPI0015EF36E3|nr:hypothetical protein [Halorhabdus salina]
MSQALTATDLRVEWTVGKRSQDADTLHWPDPDSEVLRPACDQATVSYDGASREIAPGIY